MVNSFAARLAVFVALATLAVSITAQQMRYPETRKSDQIDTFFGVKVADPYRWLEDENSPDDGQWVEAENKVTFGYLDEIPYRTRLKDRLDEALELPALRRAVSPRRVLLLLEERRPAEPEPSSTCRRASTARPRSCSTRTSFPPTAPRGSASSRCRRTARYVALLAFPQAVQTGTTST